MPQLHLQKERRAMMLLVTAAFLVLATPSAAQRLTFQTAANYATGNCPTSSVTADFNRDGKTDLVVSNYCDNSLSYLQGVGDGTFAATRTFSMAGLTGAAPAVMAVSDFNRDGNLDVAVTHPSSTGNPDGFGNQVTIHLGDGAGNFAATGKFYTGGSDNSIAAGDFNSDGKPDLVVGSLDAGTVFLHLGNGDGTFGSGQSVPFGLPIYLVAADVNRDGKLDLVAALYYGGLAILLGNGSGGFSAPTTYPTGSSPRRVVVTDLNADGNLDLAISNVTSNTVNIFVGDGLGGFSQPNPDYISSVQVMDVVAGDFDGDSFPDVLVIKQNGTFTPLYGNGTGLVQAGADVVSSATADLGAAVSADFNGDSKPDIAVLASGPLKASILLNNTAPPVNVCLLYDPLRAVNSGATYPVKLQICDASGRNLSVSSLILHATAVVKVSNSVSGDVQAAGNSNPDNDFRFDATLGGTGGYIFNLKTTGLSTGSYELKFTVNGGPISYTAPFQVK